MRFVDEGGAPRGGGPDGKGMTRIDHLAETMNYGEMLG